MQLVAGTSSLRGKAPRAGVPPLAAAPPPRHGAAPAGVLDRWQLVRQVAALELAVLYQARPMTQPEGAPADYLIKVARSDASRAIATALLKRERTVAQGVRHRHVASVLDGNAQAASPYLVLAHVGAPLRVAAPCRVRLALWRARQAAAALAALHAAGWIHTRVSPSALLVSPRGHVTVHELGWARRIGAAECRGDHLLAADLRYVAPEMLCDATELAPSCDVYGLGLLLIELLSGRPAVDAAVGSQAALAHLRGEICDVDKLRPDVPTAVVELISRLTARQPLRRPSVDQVQRELLRMEVAHLRRGGEPADRRAGSTPAPW